MLSRFHSFLLLLLLLILTTCTPTRTNNADKWEDLLDQSLSKWEIYIGVPHYSVDLEGYEKGDGKKGTPIGLGKDPLGVFTTSRVGGETILNISGEIYGGLSTRRGYENYHLSFEVKWGEKIYEPRLNRKRDSGLLYHCTGEQGAFWNVWMKSQEMQVQETDCGDYYALAGVGMDIRATSFEEGGREFWRYDPEGEVQHFKSGKQGSCRRSANYENPHGEWSTLEVICLGGTAYHVVNGKVVMVLENSVSYKDGVATPLTSGRLQIQSEAAEVYYKNIRIKAITEIPATILQEAGL